MATAFSRVIPSPHGPPDSFDPPRGYFSHEGFLFDRIWYNCYEIMQTERSRLFCHNLEDFLQKLSSKNKIGIGISVWRIFISQTRYNSK